MKILVTGGWGYGNLGDDAILLSTIKLLKEQYPKASIFITSYDASDSKIIIDDEDVKVLPSIHNLIFGNKEIIRFKYANNSFLSKLKRKFILILSDLKSAFYLIVNFVFGYKSLLRTALFFNNNIDKRIYDCDLFIMAGGGYFTSWKQSIVSHCIEVLLAKSYSSRIILVGQSTGPFNNVLMKSIVQNVLIFANNITVRDETSRDELKTLGLNVSSTIIPDLALSEDKKYNKENKITLVVFYELLYEKASLIIDVLKRVSEEFGLEVEVTISQQWNVAYDSLELFKQQSDFKITVPKDYFELQNSLGSSKLVVSQNLHGLILAYRAFTEVVSINDRRKFKGFMNIINCNDLIIGMKELDKDVLYSLIKKALNSDLEKRVELVEKTKHLFRESL